jgi:hypothetical protein
MDTFWQIVVTALSAAIPAGVLDDAGQSASPVMHVAAALFVAGIALYVIALIIEKVRKVSNADQ